MPKLNGELVSIPPYSDAEANEVFGKGKRDLDPGSSSLNEKLSVMKHGTKERVLVALREIEFE